ncbi:MAG: hypothetical protein CL936_00310 [Deltaproteobacteria bacterium]|nr:hypothetical protein [Deltaproteobacteria bacterium]
MILSSIRSLDSFPEGKASGFALRATSKKPQFFFKSSEFDSLLPFRFTRGLEACQRFWID